MSKFQWSFDRVIYTVVALPTLFFATYIASLVGLFFALPFLSLRLKMTGIIQRLGLDDAFDALTVTGWVAVIALLPATFLTIRFFIAGWPDLPREQFTKQK